MVEVTSNAVQPVITAPTNLQDAYTGIDTTINLGNLTVKGVGPWSVTVQWGDGDTSTFSPTGSGPMSLAHTYTATGDYTVSETVSEYDGGSMTTSLPVLVITDTTSTVLTTSSATAVYGQVVTFTATVTGSGTPTGTVAFDAGADQIGTGTLSVVNGQDKATFSTSTLTVSGSPYAITAIYDGDSDDQGSTSNAVSQTITPAPLSITANNASKTYGQSATFSSTAFTETGLVTANGDSITGVTETSLGPPESATVGTYPIVLSAATGTGLGNYTITYVNGTLTVNPATLTITANSQNKVYGQANPTLTVSYAGFVNGDTSSSLTTQPTVTTTATTSSPAGSYPITASGAVDPNYAISYVAGTLTISADASTTSATVSSTSVPLGQTVTVTATVTANSPGSGTPGGSVDFFDTTTNDDLGTITLAGGVATLSTAALTAGTHSIKVSYSGSSNFLASSTTASTITINQSIIVLDSTASGALTVAGNAAIKLAGGVYVDSSSSSAISASGNASVTASVIDVHGGVQKSGNATFSPKPITGAAVVPDPLASLASPSTSGVTNYGSESVSGNSSATIKPGIYSQISVSGNGSLTMNSGLYIIEGGGFSVSGNGNVKGSGVTIFNAGSNYPGTGGSYGGITISGNGSFNLTAPTTGTYAGIVIFQSRDNTKTVTLSGNASGMSGIVYAPAAQLAESGNAQLNASAIVDTLSASGNSIEDTATLDAPPVKSL